MSAQMKASVLLTLKDELTPKAKTAAKGLDALKGAANSLKGAGAGALSKLTSDANALAGAAQRASGAVRGIASASAAAGAGSGLAQATRQADALAAAAGRATAAQKAALVVAPGTRGPLAVKGDEHERAAAIAHNLDRANPGLYKGRKGAALLEKHVGEELERQAAEARGGGVMGGVGNKAMGAWFGYQVAKGVAHGIDGTISRAGDVSAMREKLRISLGGDKAGADAAYAKAMALSGKYRNTTVLENLHVIDDLRSNLPETFDHILKDIADPFVKLHGFFKGWEGGRHAGKAEHALKEVGAAIRAGELTGAMTGELLAKHTELLADARVVFGEKFKVQEYFQATQKAATMLSAADETFKYVDFPVLVQRLSQGGGVAARGMFQKLVAGITVAQSTAEAWRALGLVDESQVAFDKKGRIAPQSLVGKSWLKGGLDYGTNMTDAIMTRLVPALSEKGGLAALKGEELAKAWKEGNVEKLARILEEFRHDPKNMARLSQLVSALGKDPKATQGIEELILGSPSIMRDRQRFKEVRTARESYESYDKSKQAVAAQADRLFQTVAGSDLDGTIAKGLDALAATLGRIADTVARFKARIADPKARFEETMKAKQPAPAGPARTGEQPGLAGRTLGWLKDRLWGPAAPAGTPGTLLAERRGWMEAAATAAASAGLAISAAGYDPASAAAARMQQAHQVAASPLPAEAAAGAQPAIMGAMTAPITISAQGPQVTFNQAPPSISISVTVNATTNASPDAIGAAAAAQVNSAVRGALHDPGGP